MVCRQPTMFTGKMTTRGNLQVTAALGTKNLKKKAPKVPVAPGSNRRGVAKGQGDGELCISTPTSCFHFS